MALWLRLVAVCQVTWLWFQEGAETLQPFAICTALSPSVDRPRCFYIAALWSFWLPEFSFSLDFASGDLALTEVWIFTWTSVFHSFRVFEVGQGARSRLHMLACCIDGDNSNGTASELFDWPSFFLELPKILEKTKASLETFPRLMPQFGEQWLAIQCTRGEDFHGTKPKKSTSQNCFAEFALIDLAQLSWLWSFYCWRVLFGPCWTAAVIPCFRSLMLPCTFFGLFLAGAMLFCLSVTFLQCTFAI